MCVLEEELVPWAPPFTHPVPVTLAVHPRPVVALIVGVDQGTLPVHLPILDLPSVLHP